MGTVRNFGVVSSKAMPIKNTRKPALKAEINIRADVNVGVVKVTLLHLTIQVLSVFLKQHTTA